MKKLVSILMILAMIIPLAGAQSTDIFKKKKKKKNLFILCLSKHGSSCLLQDALFRESCHLICHISITDTAFR